jgi:hypothetical protein
VSTTQTEAQTLVITTPLADQRPVPVVQEEETLQRRGGRSVERGWRGVTGALGLRPVFQGATGIRQKGTTVTVPLVSDTSGQLSGHGDR